MLDVIILFIAGLAFLLKGADILVVYSSKLARHYHVSPFVIGMTIIAFGTSLPELSVNVISVLSGSDDLALGNIVGSNIANIGLVLGIAALLMPLAVKEKAVKNQILFMIFVSFLFFVMAQDTLTRLDGTILLVVFSAFLYFTLKSKKRPSFLAKQAKNVGNRGDVRKYIIFIVLGLAGVILGGRFLVDSAVQLAMSFGISEAIIGVTVVAVGTSLPELMVSAVAALKKEPEISVGNIVGSNTFNILFIMGLSSLLAPISAGGMQINMLVMIFFAVAMLPIFFRGMKMGRRTGFAMIVLYVAYLSYIAVTIGA